jgi:predicted  nucleic acid-binding Zn-ribbon protein
MNTTSVREQLATLLKIANIDAAARELDLELAEIPKQNEAMRNTLIRLEHMLAAERAQAQQAEHLRDEQVREVQARTELLSKSKSKAAKARNGKEAEAAEREIDSLRRGIKEREDERDKLVAALEQVHASLQVHEKEFADLRQLYAQEEEKNHSRVQELTQQRHQITDGRDAMSSKVDATIYHRYEALRAKKGSGLAELQGTTCSGCRMAIPAQLAIVVQRAETFTQCPHCLRVLYSPATFESVAPNGPSA